MNTALKPQSQFVATIKLTSDWHIGLGAGRPGEIDRLIQRDTAGLPFIPAKTLTGIWRDTCETVAMGLDNGQPGVWSDWVTYLFGDQPAIATPAQIQSQARSPQAAALSIRPATFSESFQNAIAGNQPLLAAMTFVKPGIAIDAKTGCAKENFLRFEEMARAGATLQADCELALDNLEPDQQQVAYALLVASTQLMNRLGGKRRRGAGNCELTVEDSVTDWINWIQEKNTEPPSPPPPFPTSAVNPQWQEPTPEPPSADWVSVPIHITTQSPLVMASRTLGNVVETLDYIPGSHLMRLMIQRLRSLGVSLSEAIAHQELVVTNATLALNNQRGLPVPLAVFGTKLGGGLEKGGTTYNRLVEEEPNGTQLKGARGGYVVLGDLGNLPSFNRVDKAVLTHNTIEDAVQRPTQSVGGVYSYQAIVPGTTFRAELRITAALAEQLEEKQTDWWQALEGVARLGQSKKDSYGKVVLGAEAPQPASSAAEMANVESKQLTVWLLSDLLLRDERLRPSTSVSVLAKTLGNHLGCELTLREDPAVLSVVARSHRIESWQVRWGLPRPSLTGLAAGSCFVFECADDQQINQEKLAELAVRGIGNRCAEGFGQIALNPQLLTQSLSNLSAAAKSLPPAPVATRIPSPKGTTTPVIDYARCIEKAAWRDAIRKAAEALSASPESRKQYLGFSDVKPGMSQLGSLRSVLARLQSPQQQTMQHWLTRVREKRADKWPPGSLDKLTTLFDDGNSIWTILAEGLKLAALPPFSQLVLIKQDDIWLREQLWAEAVQTLMAHSIRTHKRDQEDNSDNNSEGGETHGTAA